MGDCGVNATGADWLPAGVDTSVPSAARMYDFMLGGKDNFPADRSAVAELLVQLPDVQLLAKENRAFIGRAVRVAAWAGIDQYADLGAGLPTQGHVSEVAGEIIDDPRVLYLDNDAIAAAHARALLKGGESTTVVQADLRDPDRVLAAMRDSLDLTRPVAVLLASVLHFIGDDAAVPLMNGLRACMVPGSYLILSNGLTPDAQPTPEVMDAYEGSGNDLTLRSAERMLSWFEGFDLLDHQYAPHAADPFTDVRHWRNSAVTPESGRSAVRLLAAAAVRR